MKGIVEVNMSKQFCFWFAAILNVLFAIIIVEDAYGDTLSFTASNDGSVHRPGLLSLCNVPTKDDTGTGIRIGNSNSPIGVYRGFVEWDISSINDAAIISDVDFSWDKSVDAANDPDIVALISNRPSTTNALTLYSDIGSGTVYVDDGGSGVFPGGTLGTGTTDLGSTADSDLQSQLSSDWFAIGFLKDGNEDILCTPLLSEYDEIAADEAPANSPTLTVTFTIPNQASLSETISTSDSSSNSVTKSLSETVNMSDSLTKAVAKSNSESLSISDAISFSGSINIQALASSLVAGATYTITPNPITGIGTLTVADGGMVDDDGTNNGVIKISQVPLGSYTIVQTVTPAGFDVIVNSTTTSNHQTQINATTTFNLVSTSTNLTQLSATSVTSPTLNSTSLITLTALSATVVSTTSTTLDDVTDLPALIVAGASNTTAISSATALQSSLQVILTFPELTNGSNVIDALDLPVFVLPTSCDLVSIIPSIVTLGTTFQIVATPPLDIVPCQKMILPVADSLIPVFGGLKKMEMTVSPMATSTGIAPEEWFVFEIRNAIPSSMPSLASSGINNVVELFIDIKYPFEDTGIGHDWSNPANFAQPPRLTLYVDKPTSGSIQTDSAGCPIVDAFFFNPVSNQWTTEDISVISTISISSITCQIVIEPEHFSRLSIASRISTIVSNSDSVSNAGSGSGSRSTSMLDRIQGPIKPEKQINPTKVTTFIPNWFRNSANWWADDTMSNAYFAKGIQYLIKEKVIVISETIQISFTNHKIPSWIKYNARWWVNGQISDIEFVDGIQYLVEKGVILL